MRGARATVSVALAGLALTAVGSAIPAVRAAVATCPSPLVPSAAVAPPGGTPFIVCSGRVPSFDGTPLDTDVSIPATASGSLPLMVMMHGWGSSKTEWESATLDGNAPSQYHWNNAWFISHGYAVLTYSARGFHGSCGKDPGGLDPRCQGRRSWTHLSDRRWETHDTQYLAGLLVDDGVARADSIVATGDSYGGGQSWLLALSQDKIVDQNSTDPQHPTVQPWTSPLGTPLHLAAAVPQYPWTDLASSLIQNGRASDGFFGAPPPGSDVNPFGVPKQSYTAGLFALGVTTAQYALPGVDPTADLTSWFAADAAGEPYQLNPEAQAGLREIASAFRSPYAVPVPPPAHEIPVFFLQGHTDPLFPGIQGLQEVNRLLAADSNYPVWSFYGDLGHSYADNPPAMWQQANDQANQWLSTELGGTRSSQPRTTVTTTPCLPSQTLQTFTADRYQQIPNTVMNLESGISQQTVSSTAPEPEGVGTDPIVNQHCRVIAGGTDPNVASWTFSPTGAVTLLGSPVLHVGIRMAGVDAEVAARLWDVNPASGTQALVARTVYRLTATSPGQTRGVTFELFPNAWQLACGHQLKLELTQNDSPTWRPDNLPSSLGYSGVHLALPAVAGGACSS